MMHGQIHFQNGLIIGETITNNSIFIVILKNSSGWVSGVVGIVGISIFLYGWYQIV